MAPVRLTPSRSFLASLLFFSLLSLQHPFPTRLAAQAPPTPGSDDAILAQYSGDVGSSARAAGSAIDLDGDRLIVGAPGDSTCGRGTVWIRKWDGREWRIEATLVAPGGGDGDRFGSSVAIAGDLAVVGSGGCPSCPALNTVWIYRFDPVTEEWQEEQSLTPQIIPTGARFGDVVALSVGGGSDDRIVIGSPEFRTGGSAHVARYDAAIGVWSLEAELVPPVVFPEARFGSSVAIDGEFLIVGAPSSTDGAAYGYRYDSTFSSWQTELDFQPLVVVDSPFFGNAVAVDGPRAMVSSPTAGPQGQGLVYAFESDPAGQWSLEQLLTASDGVAAAQFGAALDLAGSVALIGAPGSIRGAYVFRFSFVPQEWVEREKLLEPDAAPSVGFAEAVAISGERAVVGDPREGVAADGDGVVHLYGRVPSTTNWPHELTLTHAFGGSGDRFGAVIAVGETHAIITSPEDSTVGARAGCARIYAVDRKGDLGVLESIQYPPGPARLDAFGAAAAIRGDRIAIGAPGTEVNGVASGVVHVLDLDPLTGEWEPSSRLKPQSVVAGGSFGMAVALGDDWLAVGAPRTDLGSAIGRVVIFRRDAASNTWQETQVLTSPSPDRRFGSTLTFVGEQLWISELPEGVPASPTFPERVLRYRFRSSSDHWVSASAIESPAIPLAARFGSTLASVGNVVAVGAPAAALSTGSQGAQFIYTVDSTSGEAALEQVLTAEAGSSTATFGTGVAISPSFLLVSSEIPGGPTGAGGVHVYRFLPTAERYALESYLPANEASPGGAPPGESFGIALGLLGDRALIGAPGNDEACGGGSCIGCDAGAVYLVELAALDPLFDCNGNGIADTLDQIEGAGTDCDANGVLDSCENSFLRGDTNGDATVNTADAVYLLSSLFLAGPSRCRKAEDTNDDGSVDVADPIGILLYLFRSGAALPPPFPDCGLSSNFGCLDCEFPSCP